MNKLFITLLYLNRFSNHKHHYEPNQVVRCSFQLYEKNILVKFALMKISHLYFKSIKNVGMWPQLIIQYLEP